MVKLLYTGAQQTISTLSPTVITVYTRTLILGYDDDDDSNAMIAKRM